MGKSAEDIAANFNSRGFKASVRQSTKESQLAKIVEIKGHPEITQIQVHPGGGLHEGKYIKISSQTKSIIKIVDRNTYKPTPNEHATILYHN